MAIFPIFHHCLTGGKLLLAKKIRETKGEMRQRIAKKGNKPPKHSYMAQQELFTFLSRKIESTEGKQVYIGC